MKRFVWVSSALALAAGYPAAQADEGHHVSGAKQTTETEEAIDVKSVEGEIIDITCYVRHDSKGAEHLKCAVYCANLGMPLGLLEDGTDKIYLILPSGHGDPKEAVQSFIAKRVKVEGIVYSTGGMAGIEVVEIEELKTEEGGKAEGAKSPSASHSHQPP